MGILQSRDAAEVVAASKEYEDSSARSPGLTVADVVATCDFYTKALGFKARESEGRWSLHFGEQKINLHPVDHTFEPKAARPTPGSGDLCFITESATEETVRHLRSLGVEVVEGPVARNGALGAMTSVYCRDPDENLIEIARYD